MKKKDNVITATGCLFILIGFVSVFISIWLDGWNILRLLITGILLILWGYSIKSKGEKE
jgi:hypothetical protein